MCRRLRGYIASTCQPNTAGLPRFLASYWAYWRHGARSLSVLPEERIQKARGDFARVCTAYENATGNLWNESDTAAFQEIGLDRIPVDMIISVLETVTRRTPTKINSFRHYLKEILAVPNRRSRAWRKKQLEKIVIRVRDSSVGRTDYSSVDFLEDVKCACGDEAVPFDDDLFKFPCLSKLDDLEPR